ncbi:MAG TPA: MBL fold metallo-hydrolase [Pyrinomonadaceae bacterium]|nr:MBL fold metallo-hydrolase [Pyrinomonadaceae bacterium]
MKIKQSRIPIAPLTQPIVLSFSFCVALLFCSSPNTLAQTDIARMSGAGQDIRKIVIADGIYQFMTMRDSYVRQLNSVVIVNENDVLVFDTNTRPSSARLILGEIRKITDKPVRYVVNSHWHPDHWSGNEVYANAFPGVAIIATEETRQLMMNVANEFPVRFRGELSRMQSVLAKETSTGKQDDGTVLTPEQRAQDEADVRDYGSFVDEAVSLRRTYPTLTYVDKLTLYLGGREFRFMSVAGDAEGTTVLYLPKEKVLITGDTISYPIPYISSPPSRHASSLKALARLDVDVIIPGHGPAFRDKEFLNLEIQLLESVIKEVHEALQKGILTLDEMQKVVTVDQLREKFAHNDKDLDARFRARVKALVKIAVREARGGQDLP